MPGTVLSPELEALLRIRNDCWYFAEQAVFTLDEADKVQPVKRYPVHLEYLKAIVDLMVHERMLALVKHRRMVITWTACMIALWDVMFNEGRRVGLVSKKEEDSDELVLRCKFIYDNIPDGALPIKKPVMTYKYTEFACPEIGSVIKGYASGADQLRQYGHSRIFADEIAFWPQARAAFASMKPTTDGGGQICLFSTRYPGFFQEVIEDRLENEQHTLRELGVAS